MKQRILLIITLLFAALFMAAFIGCADKSKEIDVKAAMSQKTLKTEPPANLDFYDQCLAKATTQEQRDALEALIIKHGRYNVWQRDALMIIGELPKDQKRITLKDADRILNEVSERNESAIILAFNAIAGALDYTGGSGITHTVYFLDDEQTDSIIISLGFVHHMILGHDGKQTMLPIGNRTFPPPATTIGKESNTPTPKPTIS